MFHCYEISILLCNSECLHMKRKLETMNLLKDTENTIDGTVEPWGTFMENGTHLYIESESEN